LNTGSRINRGRGVGLSHDFRVPKGTARAAELIECHTPQPVGSVSLSDIQHDLKLSSLKKLRETLNDAEHPATMALTAIGVKYVPGIGRGSKSFLMKAA
jgi:hypothetical protein